jgi:uncharacterized membrane protein YkvA (DUF1232 family)
MTTSEQFKSEGEPRHEQFGKVSLNAWRVSAKAVTIDEFIDQQRKEITSSDLRAISTLGQQLLDKLNETNAKDYPGLRNRINLIVRLLDSPPAKEAKDPLPAWLAEVGVAAVYLLNRYDLLPDHLPEIGLADDALIVARTIERNNAEVRGTLDPGSTPSASS